ncbi:spore coat protein CotH, partial [Anoxybacteroides tepidamans]
MYENSMSAQRNDEFKSLIGKTVTVYRGGPESKTGKLLDVQSDYLALFIENEASIIYYFLHHVQSISENAKANSIPSSSASHAAIESVQSSCFHELLKELVYNNIKVNQGGPESKQGTLLDVNNDHIVLLTEDDGVVFYHIHHIKSIRVQMKNEETAVTEAINETPEEMTEEAVEEPISQISYVNAQNFDDLFHHLTHTWVSINRGGLEAVEGILVQGSGNYYTIVNQDEIIRMNLDHIKSVSCGPKGAFQTTNTEEKNENQAEHTQNKEKEKAEKNEATRNEKKDKDEKKKDDDKDEKKRKDEEKDKGEKKKKEEKKDEEKDKDEKKKDDDKDEKKKKDEEKDKDEKKKKEEKKDEEKDKDEKKKDDDKDEKKKKDEEKDKDEKKK